MYLHISQSTAVKVLLSPFRGAVCLSIVRNLWSYPNSLKITTLRTYTKKETPINSEAAALATPDMFPITTQNIKGKPWVGP